MYSILFLALTAFVLCFLLTPLVAHWSRRQGLLDQPNAGRKVHLEPVPRTGGVAIVLAYAASVGLLLVSPLHGATSVDMPLALHLFPAVGVIFLVGLYDDIIGLRARVKLLGQIVAAGLAFYGGVRVTAIGHVDVPLLASLPLTVLWLVACTNAFNLIDGVDGLAAGIGLFATFTILAAALFGHLSPLALAVAPLLGALLAFLRYNFNPASIFLGDSGSLTIGFMLGCFGAIWSQKSATLLGMAAPLMALAVPLLDTAIAVLRRFIRHQPIFSPDRNHLHHRLLDRGFSPRQVVLIVYGACGVAAAFSLLETVPRNRFGGLLLVLFCAAAWAGVYLTGYIEFDAAKHLVLTGTFRHILNARLVASRFERNIAAAVTPEDYWVAVRDVARELECVHLRMSVAGMVYEDREAPVEARRSCTIRVPLSDTEYANFTYPAETSARHVVVIGAIVEILQRAWEDRDSTLSGLSTSRGGPEDV